MRPDGWVDVPLAPFATVDRSTLRWLRTGETTPEFTLLAGESAVATMRWHQPHGARAVAETADGSFTLGRGGFLVPHLTARRAGSDAPVARLTNRLSHHELEVGGGGVYRLKRAGLLVPAWTLTAANGETVHLEPATDGHRIEGGAIIGTTSIAPGELMIVLLLCWYLIVLLWIEDEAIEALVPFEGPDAPARLGRGA